jgi:hypothetical protein
MAQTFRTYCAGVSFAATKNMHAILNGHATEILKIRRVGLSNAQTAAVTGVVCAMEHRLYTGSGSLTAPTAVTPVSMDSTNTAPTTATYGHAGTIGGTANTLNAWIWSSDEAAVSAATSDELECLIPLNVIYDWIPHSDVQPITLRQNEMNMIYNVSGAAGLLHSYQDFTKE